jgi:hypothetical protein
MAEQNQDYEVLTKQVAAIEANLVEMTKRAEVAERNLDVSKLDEDDRNAYAALSKDDQEKYHTCKDSNCKDGILAKGYETLEKANAMPEAIAKQFADIKKQLDESNAKREAAEAAIKKSQDEADLLRFAKQAGNEFGNLPGTDEEKGAILKSLTEKLSADELAGVTKLLKAGNESHGTITKSISKASGGAVTGTDTWAMIVAKANESISKSGVKMTEAVAIEKFLQTPEGGALYQQYLKEDRAQ